MAQLKRYNGSSWEYVGGNIAPKTSKTTSDTDTYSCNYVNSALKWTLVDNKTGTTEITLPSNYNEILIIVKSTDTARNWNFGVFPEELIKGLTNNRAFRSGHYSSSSDYSACALWVKPTGKIELASASFNGNTITSSCITYVYYR